MALSEGLREAARAYAAGDWQACLSSLDEVDSTLVNHLDLAYLLGLVHARLEHWDTALLYLEQVVTGSDEILRVCQCRLVLSWIYLKTGRARLAEYELQQLSSTGFESVQTCSGFGFASWEQGKGDEAIKWYEKALGFENGNPNALNGLGYVLAVTGKDLPKALACCRRAVQASPDNPAYLDSLAWACFRSGRAGEGRELIVRALSLSPEHHEILEHARAMRLDLPEGAEP
ncbi:MAG TPA: tetratricopeptide repeat protein [Rectinemataceae bacterium]|nr:tetratricopeptide repeat protein [Rectinemataceae bacterium]